MAEHIERVGYIGMGIMGSAMAGNLLKAGFKVTVWNRTAGKCKPLAAQGAKVASSIGELMEDDPDVVCVNVSDTPDVEEVIFGEGGVASGAKEGLIVIDHSTISPVATKDFAARLKEQGVTLLDAPVSGGDVGARNGTLSIMCGGEQEAFDRCMPMLKAMGKSIVRLGEAGMGQACKACNQIAVSCNLLGTVEAMALARKLGLDLEKMIEVVSGGAAGSWQLANLGPKIAAGDYAPGFMVKLILKDLRIISETADENRLPLSGTELARGYLKQVAEEMDGGELGTQAMAKAMEKAGGFVYSE